MSLRHFPIKHDLKIRLSFQKSLSTSISKPAKTLSHDTAICMTENGKFGNVSWRDMTLTGNFQETVEQHDKAFAVLAFWTMTVNALEWVPIRI
jgi:hypothetical protein